MFGGLLRGEVGGLGRGEGVERGGRLFWVAEERETEG